MTLRSLSHCESHLGIAYRRDFNLSGNRIGIMGSYGQSCLRELLDP